MWELEIDTEHSWFKWHVEHRGREVAIADVLAEIRDRVAAGETAGELTSDDTDVAVWHEVL